MMMMMMLTDKQAKNRERKQCAAGHCRGEILM